MAYRFVLEVPARLGAEAQAVIDGAPAAEVITVRRPATPDEAQGRVAIAVVAHALDVIDAIYQWLAEQPDAADVALARLSGPRIRLMDADAAATKAWIKGEQGAMALTAGSGRSPSGGPAAGTGTVAASLQPYGLTQAPEGPVIEAERSLVIEAIDHLAVRVADIQRAEEFYRDFFQMDLVLRAHHVDGTWERLPRDYDWDEGLRQGITVDLVYLSHPPLSLVLLNAGRGAVFAPPRIDHISLRVSPGTLLTIRAQALVRSFPVLAEQPHTFIFRDPFGLTWHLTDIPAR
ncbi:MAG: VOC family protein [Sphaerobacter sp.]|nr:VOC family protein [Sphaerobacter sp.]